ncbi:beta-ketoacyl-ACP synthase II [Chloroflexota bacterium]
MERKRVVITGLGTVNPLANSIEEFWQGLQAGKSGITAITRFDTSEMPCHIAGEVKDFDPLDYMDRKTVRRVPYSTQLAVAAAHQAIEDAGLPLTMPKPERAGVMLGTAVAGMESILNAHNVMQTQGFNRLNPYQVPGSIPNMPAFQIAKEFQCLGPNNTTATACAAGTLAVGEGTEMIRRGAVDIVISGGTEAIVVELVLGAFSVMRALPVNYNDQPTKASRPFDANREGFVLSEGAGVLVLEELNHALERGASIYAEVAGQASSSDGYHLAALKPDGVGPSQAMRWALLDAGVQPQEVDYINAHGTSTPLNDAVETLAIKNVFGDDAYNIPVSSTKSMIGHAMGAAGAMEAIACALTIRHDLIHPTINYETPDPECDLNYVPNEALTRKVDVVLSNSFGLGGQNACLVLKKYTGMS